MKRYLIMVYTFLCAVCIFTAAVRESAPTEEHYRVLQEYNGVIGVYDSERNLLEVVDYPCILLTEYDRKEMEQGIAVESEEELRRRIEDYTS